MCQVRQMCHRDVCVAILEKEVRAPFTGLRAVGSGVLALQPMGPHLVFCLFTAVVSAVVLLIKSNFVSNIPSTKLCFPSRPCICTAACSSKRTVMRNGF